MEEDTGKLLHEVINNEKVSLIDFNRSGVPLVEIVTEPDFSSALEVKEYLKKLQQIIRYLGVSDADMEKGQMRLEPNISLRLNGETKLPKYKVEVKNINSFNFVEDAINFEIKRQQEILDKGELPKQETRGWNEDRNESVSQRSKEDAMDYRYFPEPDIPPIKWKKEYIDSLKSKLPELADEKIKRFEKVYEVTSINAKALTKERLLADYFEECVKASEKLSNKVTANSIANWIINKKIDINKTLPAEVLAQIIASTQVTGIDPKELDIILNKIIENNRKVIDDYKAGKENAIMFLVGMAMKQLKGQVKADEIKAKLLELIK